MKTVGSHREAQDGRHPLRRDYLTIPEGAHGLIHCMHTQGRARQRQRGNQSEWAEQSKMEGINGRRVNYWEAKAGKINSNKNL